DWNVCLPRGAAVRRPEGTDRVLRGAGVRDDHGAARLDHGLAAETGRVVRRVPAHPPVQAAVARGAHVDEPPGAVVVPLDVAVAVVGARRAPVVAGDPRLVEVGVGSGRGDGDRFLPRPATVGRAADHYRVAVD